jgi:hypothetical protein
MNDYELLEKRVLPSLTEEEKSHLTDECILDLIKIARTFEPNKDSATIIVEKEFKLRDGSYSCDKFKPENYSFGRNCKHLFYALDLTGNHNPKQPILQVVSDCSSINFKKGGDQRNVGSRTFKYAKLENIESEKNRLYIIPIITPSYNNYKLNPNFDLFGTRWEIRAREKAKNDSLMDLSSPISLFAVDGLFMPIEKLRRYQEDAYQISIAEADLAKKIEPLKEELAGIQRRIIDIEQPETDRISEAMDKLYQESFGADFHVVFGKIGVLGSKEE